MKKIIILYFLGALLLSGCMRDEFDTTRVEEGIAARVSLRVLLPDMDGAVSAGNTRTSANTRAVDAAVENRLDSLRVLVFNSSGQIVTNRKYTAQSDGSLSSLQIDTWSGNNLTFCFVANSRDDLDNRLAVVTSYNDLREFMVTASSLNFGLSDTGALIMTAIVENVNVQPGSDTISDPIQLQFLAAKLTLTVTDATPDGHAVTILGWDVQDVPARSYLFPDSKDANPAPEGGADKEEYWLTTASDYPSRSTGIKALLKRSTSSRTAGADVWQGHCLVPTSNIRIWLWTIPTTAARHGSNPDAPLPLSLMPYTGPAPNPN